MRSKYFDTGAHEGEIKFVFVDAKTQPRLAASVEGADVLRLSPAVADELFEAMCRNARVFPDDGTDGTQEVVA